MTHTTKINHRIQVLTFKPNDIAKVIIKDLDEGASEHINQLAKELETQCENKILTEIEDTLQKQADEYFSEKSKFHFR